MSGVFYVDPPALSGLVKQVQRLGGDAAAVRDYVREQTRLSGGEGWLNQLSGAHAYVVSCVTRWLDTLERPVAADTAAAVARAVAFYESADTTTAARFDAAVEPYSSLVRAGHPETFHAGHAAAGTFEDVGEPAGQLAPVPDYAGHPDYRYQPEWYDLVSPASLGRDAVWAATSAMARLGILDRGFDPYESFLKPVVGDWAGLRGCRDVFRAAGNATAMVQHNLTHAGLVLDRVWRGNAADACTVHLGRIGEAVGGAQAPLHAIAERYREAADGAALFRGAVGTVLSDLIDAAIVLGLAVAAGTATVETGVGPVIGGLIGLYEAHAIVQMINQVLNTWAYVETMMETIESALYHFGQLQAADFVLPRLPEAGDPHSALPALPRA